MAILYPVDQEPEPPINVVESHRDNKLWHAPCPNGGLTFRASDLAPRVTHPPLSSLRYMKPSCGPAHIIDSGRSHISYVVMLTL